MSEIAPFSGLLDEHAPKGDASDKPGDANYEPTDDEKKAIKLAENIFQQNKKHRAQYDQKWLDYYWMYRGKQWKEQRPSYRHSEVFNLIFRTIQSNVPIQVDSRPKFEFLAQEPTDYELAQILNDVAEADWTNNNWGEQQLEVLYDANITGTGISSMLVKDHLGSNKIVYASADPFYSFPDPEARDVNKDSSIFGYDDKAATFCYAEPMDVRKIRKKYPAVKDFIKPDVIDLMKGSKTDSQPLKFRSPIDNKVILEGGPSQDLHKEQAILLTVYLSPEYTEEDFEETRQDTVDPDSGMPGPPEYIQQAKFPNGRKIVVCNGVLCEDSDAGYDDQEFPFSRYVNYLLPREFWGQSEIEQLEGPQKTFNKVASFVLDVLTLMGNPVWVIPTSANIDEENLVNKPGLQVLYDGDKPPERLPGVELQPYVMQLLEKVGELFDSIGGSQDVSRGIQPTGITAASAISSLQQAAQTRLRLKMQNMDRYLQDVGQKYRSRVFQFYTVPQVFRLTNNQGVVKYFRMHVESYEPTLPEVDPMTGAPHPQAGQPTGETRYKVHYQPYNTDQSGSPAGFDPTQATVYDTSGKFDTKVSTGSSLPFEKDQLKADLLALFDRGIIDNEEVLKRSDYPNYEAVMQRMQMKAQQQAQAQQQQGQPPPGAKKPTPATPPAA